MFMPRRRAYSVCDTCREVVTQCWAIHDREVTFSSRLKRVLTGKKMFCGSGSGARFPWVAMMGGVVITGRGDTGNYGMGPEN